MEYPTNGLIDNYGNNIMAKKPKNFYAVKRGHKLGIFESWYECEQAIIGYSGAVYKGFRYRYEAVEFLAAKMPKWSGNHKKPVKPKPVSSDGKFKYASMRHGRVYKTTYPIVPETEFYNGDLPPWN